MFERTFTGENSDLWTVQPDGSNETRLTISEFDEGFAVWSPDGTMIAFNYLTDLWTMNADGANRVDIGGNVDQNVLRVVVRSIEACVHDAEVPDYKL